MIYSNELRDLNSKIPKAPNFQYIEFVRSNTAQRFNVPNNPTKTQWQNIEYLAQSVLQPIRNKFGPIRINSGFRSPEVNKKVGGSLTSFHSHGMAADVIPLTSGVTNMDLLVYVFNELPFTELIYEFPPQGWVHVGLQRGRETERTLKLRDDNHLYSVVTMGYIRRLYKE